MFFAGFYVMIKEMSLGELVRQAERKLKISTLIPDADSRRRESFYCRSADLV